jgi:dihydrofolate reductase
VRSRKLHRFEDLRAGPRVPQAISRSKGGTLCVDVEGPDGQFGWATPDAELHKHFNANAATMTTHLYGRRMWETLSAYWPTAQSDPAGTPETREFARFWNAGEHVVDEIRVYLNPLAVGGGKPFFSGLKGRLDLTLRGVQRSQAASCSCDTRPERQARDPSGVFVVAPPPLIPRGLRPPLG